MGCGVSKEVDRKEETSSHLVATTGDQVKFETTSDQAVEENNMNTRSNTLSSPSQQPENSANNSSIPKTSTSSTATRIKPTLQLTSTIESTPAPPNSVPGSASPKPPTSSNTISASRSGSFFAFGGGNKPSFKGVQIDQVLLCRDCFHSKYTGNLMYKWRKIEVKKIEGSDFSRIFVHFVGWADSFDHWIDLNKEIDRVAPVKLLSKNQIDNGGELDEEQLRYCKEYLLTGSLPASISASMKDSNVGGNSPSAKPASGKHRVANPYIEGQLVSTFLENTIQTQCVFLIGN